MALAPCISCHQQVAASARRCPYCGEKRPAATIENAFKSLLLLVVVVIFLIALIAH